MHQIKSHILRILIFFFPRLNCVYKFHFCFALLKIKMSYHNEYRLLPEFELRLSILIPIMKTVIICR